MKNIYENILPGKEWNSTMITLGERLMVYGYMRDLFANLKDGDDISLGTDKSKNSLLSYIRFMELNPGSYNPLFNNPYKNLADGFLLYSSCYPLRYDKNRIICAKNSMGINIRIYRLTNIEYDTYKTGEQSQYLKYDVWREIAFYEYIREVVLKKKMCPHFSILYNYFISTNNEVNFDKLKLITGDNRRKAVVQAIKENEKKIRIRAHYLKYCEQKGDYSLGPAKYLQNTMWTEELKEDKKGEGNNMSYSPEDYTEETMKW
jgi:hypothetical protein